MRVFNEFYEEGIKSYLEHKEFECKYDEAHNEFCSETVLKFNKLQKSVDEVYKVYVDYLSSLSKAELTKYKRFTKVNASIKNIYIQDMYACEAINVCTALAEGKELALDSKGGIIVKPASKKIEKEEDDKVI